MHVEEGEWHPTLVGTGGVKHFVLLVGWDSRIIVHDPGTSSGRFKAYTVKDFDASWATQNRVYILVSKKKP